MKTKNKNRNEKWAYLHIPKTGGTYVNQHESKDKPVICPIENLGHSVITENPFGLSEKNFPPQGIGNKIKKRGISGRHIIVSVRNPYSWLVSYAGHAGVWPNKYVNKDHYDYQNAQKGFKFLIKKISQRDHPWPCKKFLFFQMFTDKGELLPDFVARNETLDKDLEKLSSLTNLKYSKKTKQRLGNHKDYKEYYDQELKDLVEKTWRRELKLFGYNFEGCQKQKAIIKNWLTPEQKRDIRYCWKTDKLTLPKTK